MWTLSDGMGKPQENKNSVQTTSYTCTCTTISSSNHFVFWGNPLQGGGGGRMLQKGNAMSRAFIGMVVSKCVVTELFMLDKKKSIMFYYYKDTIVGLDCLI